jgi:hypothetical protein
MPNRFDRTANPLSLRGLNQAIFIMRYIDLGKSKQEIVKRFNGDEQLVDLWISYMRHNHWLESNNTGGLKVTDKARSWLAAHPL